MSNHQQTAQAVAFVLPDRTEDLERLCALAEGGEPVVTVVGKYNHGKSRLLNALIGLEAFAVADRRETVVLSDRLDRGVRWLDAPGLDADIGADDDRKALQAAWLSSDIRLFVHAAKEGELDAKELALLAQLRADAKRTRRSILFVLTQIDQLDDADLCQVRAVLGSQKAGMAPHAVSAARYQKGVGEGKTLLQEKSGMPGLRVALDEALANVAQARAHEAALLSGEIREALAQRRAEQTQRLHEARHTQRAQREAFEQGLKTILDKVAGDIRAMLDVLGADHAIVPDAAKDAYALTAGKRERAHIQIAYSRACIEIDSFLAGHGVVGLPQARQTEASSLNSVMVAVMGVSVKFRADLRKMFCQACGRERMRGEFVRYYELSEDRQALAARTAGLMSDIAATQRAMSALDALEASL